MDSISSIELNIKSETILHDKCAEIIRDITSGTYCFQCYHCGQLLQADSSDCADIFSHLDTHYVFEQEDDAEQNAQTKLLAIEFLNVNSSRHETDDGGGIEILKEKEIKEEIIETEENVKSELKNPENLECNVCHQTFFRKNSFMMHCRQHTSNCKEVELNNSKIQTLQKMSKYSCTICGSVYFSKRSLSEHKRRNHKKNLIDFTEFKHIAKHLLGPATCDICGRSYPTKFQIKNHMRLHMNKNKNNRIDKSQKESIYCTICSKTYCDMSALKRHHKTKHYDKLLPTISTKYKCELCDTVFSEKIFLKSHMKCHQNNKDSLNCIDQEKLDSEFFQDHTLVEGQNETHKHKCGICGIVYCYKQDLTDHLKLKHPDEYYSSPLFDCDFCNKQFFQKKTLIAHMKRKHSNVPFDRKQIMDKPSNQNECKLYINKSTIQRKPILQGQEESEPKEICTICGKRYQLRKSLRDHRRLKHPNDFFPSQSLKCKVCGKRYVQNINLKRHMQTHTESEMEKTVECEKCGETYFDTDGLQAHWQKNHPKECPTKLLTCKFCDKTFMSEDLLNYHKINHNACEICGLVYSDIKNLRTHCKKFHPSKYPESLMFKCEYCNLCFVRRPSLYLHMKIHKDIYLLSCDVCGIKFRKKFHLKEHMQTHYGKRFKCETCGKTFTNRGNLNTHNRTHTGEKPYECTFCERRFAQRTDMTTHIKRIHTGEKAFQCEICGKKFVHSSLLKNHIKKHNGDKQFQCQYCDKKFYTNYLKKVHETSHSEIMEYSCDVCHRPFRSKRTLAQHKTLHTGEKAYTCKYCGMKFAQPSGRRSHEKNIHGAV